MPLNRLPRVMKHCSPTGRRNLGRSLKRLLGTWDRNGSTSGPTQWQIYCYDDLLDKFVKLWKATPSFVVSVRPYVRPHWTARLPLDGFSWNFIFEYFSKICRGISSFIKMLLEWRVLYMRAKIHFFIISRSFLLRMRNVSDKSCRENQNT